MIPQYNDGWGAGVVHVESQNISDDVFNISISRGDNIVLPKVGSDADKVAKEYIIKAKSHGYKVNVHYVELDRNKAMSRMINRFIDQGRYLAPELIEKYAPFGRENRIDIAYGELKDSGIIDGYSKWDNDVALGERPVLIETNCKGGFVENARRDERTRINEEVAVAGEGILAGAQGGLVSADLRGGRSAGKSEHGILESARGRNEQAVAHRKNEASKQDKQVVQDRQHTGDERGGNPVAAGRNAGAARGLGGEAGMDKGEARRAGKGAERETGGEIRSSVRAKLEAYKAKAAAASRQGKPPERGGEGKCAEQETGFGKIR
ncbi:MAG: zeta toxin family protein [Clostridiales bacterium]|nr:zeta toxin family protein [Clostridiales bacterium]